MEKWTRSEFPFTLAGAKAAITKYEEIFECEVFAIFIHTSDLKLWEDYDIEGGELWEGVGIQTLPNNTYQEDFFLCILPKSCTGEERVCALAHRLPESIT